MDLTSYLRQDRRVKFDSAKAEKAVVAGLNKRMKT